MWGRGSRAGLSQTSLVWPGLRRLARHMSTHPLTCHCVGGKPGMVGGGAGRGVEWGGGKGGRVARSESSLKDGCTHSACPDQQINTLPCRLRHKPACHTGPPLNPASLSHRPASHTTQPVTPARLSSQPARHTGPPLKPDSPLHRPASQTIQPVTPAC